MGRNAGPNKKWVEKIKRYLRKNPRGLWIRELARKTKLDKTTISRYLSTYMKKNIKETDLGPKGLIRIVKLKRRRKKLTS